MKAANSKIIGGQVFATEIEIRVLNWMHLFQNKCIQFKTFYVNTITTNY